jgi:hypothetical protein
VSHPNRLGFEFARKLADPAFRRRLKECGWASGTAVFPAAPGETEAEVKERMELGRHLLVMLDPAAKFGMSMLMIEVDA